MSTAFSLQQLPRCAIMGILNVTPDSFSDGGQFAQTERAVSAALNMHAQGASLIDVGGESTRPGASAVSEQQELDRVIPVIEAIRTRSDVPISIDTSKPVVMDAALQAGASMINDVNALRAEHALSIASAHNVPVCIMHMQGKPRDMQHQPQYSDVVAEIRAFLQERIDACLAAGIARSQIVLDPGFGFGKTLAHNYQLFNAIPALLQLGLPLLVGVSRKSMLGNVVNKAVDQRVAASIAAATLAAQMGAHIIRVHDVDQTADAVKIVNACKQYQLQQ
ncbi:dihydropteroate synthase [Alteromonas oceanisediminis]|uniref:dihydropteroate synthase n=1 Tax=Alteromonas oceanisediminis TaxID=2836180 RepID=UPI001BD95B2D|nr:dihydropteroate synthase [Alteromonas oceanisediminis]MBT0586519.1 dihydropteroate synthase [Alteromonas oceanisediminis]